MQYSGHDLFSVFTLRLPDIIDDQRALSIVYKTKTFTISIHLFIKFKSDKCMPLASKTEDILKVY